jgi:hypothetical protein
VSLFATDIVEKPKDNSGIIVFNISTPLIFVCYETKVEDLSNQSPLAAVSRLDARNGANTPLRNF